MALYPAGWLEFCFGLKLLSCVRTMLVRARSFCLEDTELLMRQANEFLCCISAGWPAQPQIARCSRPFESHRRAGFCNAGLYKALCVRCCSVKAKLAACATLWTNCIILSTNAHHDAVHQSGALLLASLFSCHNLLLCSFRFSSSFSLLLLLPASLNTSKLMVTCNCFNFFIVAT